MKQTITKEHLERALAEEWNPKTCLIQQALTDVGIERLAVGVISWGSEADDLMFLFDYVHGSPYSSEDEQAIGLTLLELILPMEDVYFERS